MQDEQIDRIIPVGIVLVTLVRVAQAAIPAAQGGQEAPATTEAPKVDLNRASSLELQELPGVGARTAELIIGYREGHGRFDKVEDLMNVRGIGERRLLRLRELVEVGPVSGSDR
jgi:comEA protein